MVINMKKKKLIILGVIVLIIIIIAIARAGSLSKSTENEYKYTVESEVSKDDYIEEETSINTVEDEYVLSGVENGFVTENDKGFIELRSFSSRSNMLNPCYDTHDSETGFILVWKNANEIIPKISKNSIIGITDTYEEIKLVPVGSNKPQYMIPLNFGADPVRDVAEFPNNLENNGIHFAYPSDNIDFESGDLLLPGNPLVECNNVDLTTFVNDNCDKFVYDTNGGGWGLRQDRGYRVINGDKNQEFTFGGYVGTEWHEFTSKACVEYYKIYANENGDKITQAIATEKTKEGYFTVDFSNLEKGVYYVSTYNTFVEIV